MKFIKNFFEKTEPLVQKGAKYHWLGSVHEGFFTFLYVSKDTSKSGTHIHDFTDLKRTMAIVVLALVPAILFGMYNTGLQHFKAIGEIASTGFFEIFLYGLSSCSTAARLSGSLPSSTTTQGIDKATNIGKNSAKAKW